MRRNAHVGLILLAYSILVVPAFAAAKSPLAGTWTLDLSRFPVPNPPRRVTMTLEESAGGKYKMIVDITDRDGSRRHGTSIFQLDGTPAATTGNADYDVVTMTMPSRKILVMGGEFKGHPANTRVWSLSDDGRHMIETVVWHTPDGTPHTRVDYWNRVK